MGICPHCEKERELKKICGGVCHFCWTQNFRAIFYDEVDE